MLGKIYALHEAVIHNNYQIRNQWNAAFRRYRIYLHAAYIKTKMGKTKSQAVSRRSDRPKSHDRILSRLQYFLYGIHSESKDMKPIHL